MTQTEKRASSNNPIDFISNFVIINNAPAWINFDEGRVIMDGTNVYFTETHLRDHLGNTRVVFGYKNNALLVKQVNSYYPFGMNIKGLTTYTFGVDRKHPANEYLYNGKMFQDELGLDWLDYGWRMYDAQLGRWHGVDPLAEVARRWSPYAYCYNNPIRFIDPDGMLAGDFYSQTGKYLGTDGKTDGKVYVVTDNKEAKSISKNTKAGQTTSTSDVKSSIQLPSAYVRGKMGEAVDRSNKPTADDKKGGFHEEGGVFGTKDGQEWVAEAKPGPVADPSVDKYAQINVLDTKEGQVIPSATCEGTYHVHPAGQVEVAPPNNTIGGGQVFGFEQTPSGVVGGAEGDIPIAASRPFVTGNSYVLGARSGIVTIYNGSGVVATFPLDKFITIGTK